MGRFAGIHVIRGAVGCSGAEVIPMPQIHVDPRRGNTASLFVNGLKMYYEIHGTGKPLVLLHGGG
jgi:hypothetical protein